MSIGMKNLIKFSRKRNEKTMAAKLAGEIMAAAKKKVLLIKEKKILTVWQMPTKHSLTSDFNIVYVFYFNYPDIVS
jgi:hypothetical protein